MEIVEPGTYDFDLAVIFPAAMKSAYRGSSGRVTVKDLVEKAALAKRLTDRLTDLDGKDVTVTRLELIPTSGPTVAEQAVIDYMDCIRVAATHVDSCLTCQSEQYCDEGEPILYHFELALERYQRRESLLV